MIGRKFCVACLIVLALCRSALADDAPKFKQGVSLEDAHGAVCRVRVNGAMGTGFFFGCENGNACIATNYHVVTKNQVATFDFWTNGYMQSITGKLVWKSFDGDEGFDFAVGYVDPNELKKIDPPWLPLAGADAYPSIGAVIISCGAPDGRFTQAWKGQILEYYNGKTAIFSPPPVPGQSGSPICEYVDGQLFVTGILTWLIGEKGRDDSKGGAIPISNLYKALKKRGMNVDFHAPDASPIPPGATECAAPSAKAPCVLEFTQENCPPCKEAENDVAQLRAFGVEVYVYDVASEIGKEYSTRFKVDKTPSFVLLDETYRPAQTFVGAGKVDEILDAHGKIMARLRVANEKTQPPTREGTSENISIDVPSPSEAPSRLDQPIDIPATSPIKNNEEDFRYRAPVYEIAEDVSIFEESDRRWRDLKRKKNEREDETNPAEDDCKRPKLGERITDGATDAIAQRIERFADGKIQAMKDDLREKWESVKLALLVGLCVIVIVGVIVAETLVSFAKWAWRVGKDKIRVVRAALVAAKDFKND